MNTAIVSKIKYAFLKSIPVMCGYIFLGIAFGILLQNAGYNFLWALFISLFVYAGSMQFVMVPLLATAVSPLTMAVTTMFVNSRHLFYGFSFIESFNKIKAKIYMIFALTDETYSVLCSCRNEDPDENHRSAWVYISMFNQIYWIAGSVLGTLIEKILPIDFSGIEFSMTALFIVILIEQIHRNTRKIKMSAVVGAIAGVLCLLIFGENNFLLFALVITTFVLYGYCIFESKIQKEGDNS